MRGALDRALRLDDHMRRQSRRSHLAAELGPREVEAAFRENEIDETILPSLTHETLQELGVTAVGTGSSCSMPSPRCVPMRAASRRPLTQRPRLLSVFC